MRRRIFWVCFVLCFVLLAGPGPGLSPARAGRQVEKEALTAEPAGAAAFKPTGEWNHFKITFQGSHIQVELNGLRVVDWKAEPRGKVKDFAAEGYIGLQNHDSIAPVYFRNIFIKEL